MQRKMHIYYAGGLFRNWLIIYRVERMNKYTRLIKNLGVFFIASFGSKMLTFFLVPLYTHVLSTEEYGISDIIITTVSLILPIITLSISEAALRFSLDKGANHKSILNSSFLVFLIGSIISVFLFPVFFRLPYLSELFSKTDFVIIFYLILFSNGVYIILSQFCRGLGKVFEYALGSVISALVLIVSNIVFLLAFNYGINGYLLSMALTYIIPSIYYCFVLKIWNYGLINNLSLLKPMLMYSIPLIPNALSWWAMQAADKYILIAYTGVAANGLYTVSQKIPSILNVLSGVFIQAWQLSAVEESTSQEKNQFYSSVFNYLICIMVIATSLIVAVIKIVFSVWVSKEYYSAWLYTPILLFANMFSWFSVFVGTNYMAMKKTKGNLKTTLIACIINIVLNFVFIPRFGIVAASITTMISFLIVWIIRVIDTRDYVRLEIKYMKFIFSIILICIQFVLHLYNLSIVYQVVPVFLIFLFYLNDLKLILNSFLKRNK